MDWRPLILEWLGVMRDQAKVQAARPNGSRFKLSAVEKAIESIETLTEQVNDPSELKGLPRVGEKTLTTICSKIKKHCSTAGISLPPSMQREESRLDAATAAPPAKRVLSDALQGQSYPFAPPPPPAKRRREYIPAYNSPAYHVLMTMRLNERDAQAAQQGIGQSELTRLVKPRVQGVLEGAVSRSTPAIGMVLKTLCKNDLVYLKNGRYFLDEPGRDMATRLLVASGELTPEEASALNEGHCSAGSGTASGITSKKASIALESQHSLEDEDGEYQVETWEAGTFITKLLVDNREVASKNDRAGLVNDLRTLGIDLDVQTLTLGDCLWVAEHTASGRRAVLDWIVERKTLGDLRSSIHDGRYHEQKKRLAKSTMKNIVYLVEFANNMSNSEMFKDNRKKFMTAMSQTLVKENFHLKLTKSQNETVNYLARMTRLINSIYTPKPLQVVVPRLDSFEESMRAARTDVAADGSHFGVDYSAFHEGLTKSKLRTVGETFRLMLRSIKGISAEKAMAIQRIYPTPSHLRRSYLALDGDEKRRQMVFAATRGCVRRQQIRAALSELIWEIWAP